MTYCRVNNTQIKIIKYTALIHKATAVFIGGRGYIGWCSTLINGEFSLRSLTIYFYSSDTSKFNVSDIMIKEITFKDVYKAIIDNVCIVK